MADNLFGDSAQEAFGKSVGEGLERIGLYLTQQATTLTNQAATAAERAEFARGMWQYLDELGTRVVGELEYIKTATQLESQIVARVSAMQQALGQAEAFAAAATQSARVGEILTTLGKNAGGIIAAVELIGQLRKTDGTAYEVGGELSKIAGGVVVGGIAAAAGLSLAPVIGFAIIGGTLAKYIWDDYVARNLGWSNTDSPGFWENLFSNLGFGPNHEISPTIATTFNNFSLYPQQTDPFTLDLDNDGIETVGVNATTPLLFDIDAVGIKKSVGWVKADDGLLALDRDGNGTIDSGAELFGDATPVFDTQGNLVRQAADGFDALAQQDSNLDGVIDNLDTNWTNLRVWQDANQDGISQTAELKTLDELNITAIHLAKVEHSTPLANGNVLADLGSYTRSDGTEGGAGTAAQLADIDLAVDSFHSQFADHIPLTVEAAALPDIQGSGQVRSLREAASLDTPEGAALAALLTQYSQATSKSAQLALLDPLLKAWSDTSPMAATFTGAYAGHALTVDMQGVWSPDNVSNPGTPAYQAWAQKLTIMEHFNGRTYAQVPDGTDPVTITLWHSPRDLLQSSYDALRTSFYQRLALQTRFKPYLDEIDLSISDTGIHLDFSRVKADFVAKIDADPANGIADLMEFSASTREVLADSGWNGVDLIVDYIGMHAMTAPLLAALAANGIRVKGLAGWSGSGGAGDDVLIGDGRNDKSRRWRDGGQDVIRTAENDAVFEVRRKG